MADKNLLKEELKRKLDLSTPKILLPKQLEEAAGSLIKEGTANRELLEKIGEKVAGDKQVFKNTDIDDVITILDQIKGA